MNYRQGALPFQQLWDRGGGGREREERKEIGYIGGTVERAGEKEIGRG